MTARRIVCLALAPYVVWLIVAYHYHFLDGVNLLLHEAGHVVFGFAGEFLHFLGGTLGQLFFPAAFVIYFLRRRERFEAAVCGIWTAESLMYTARYLGDAQAQALPLVGGHIHDWNWLLTRMGLLQSCTSIAGGLHFLASLLAIAAWLYGARELFAKPVANTPATETESGINDLRAG